MYIIENDAPDSSKNNTSESYVGIKKIISGGPYNALLLLRAATCDFQQCGNFTSVDSDEPVQPPFMLRNSK